MSETEKNDVRSPLARALAQAQGEMRSAVRDRTNPHFRAAYATLASVWDACREPLARHGLAVVQLVTSGDRGSVTVETRLLHESGEAVSSSLTLPVAQPTAQGVGSAITYARRYALSALVGIAPDDDDDGNEASRPAPVSARPTSAPSPTPTPPTTTSAPSDGWPQRIATASTLEALATVGRELARTPASVRDAHRSAYVARHAALSTRDGAR